MSTAPTYLRRLHRGRRDLLFDYSASRDCSIFAASTILGNYWSFIVNSHWMPFLLGKAFHRQMLENNSPNLWRLNVATGELKQRTYAKDAEKGSCTPDGKWVVYTEEQATDALGQIFKISVDGGTPVELAHGTAFSPVVSLHGKLIAYLQDRWAGSKCKVEDCGAKARKRRDRRGDRTACNIQLAQAGVDAGWARLTYVHNTTGSTENVYMQPLAGGPPVQLTDFDSEPAIVAAYAWSQDGKKFAITRSRSNVADVVMFSGFK